MIYKTRLQRTNEKDNFKMDLYLLGIRVWIYFMTRDNLSDGDLYMVMSESWSSHNSEC